MLVRSALACLLGAGPLLTSSARAAPPPASFSADDLALRWTAPPECPERAALLRAIARRLRGPLPAVDARVDAEVVRAAGRYTLRLQLTIDGRHEARELHDVSCAALTDAIAVRFAAAVQPPVPERVLVPPPAPPALPDPPAPAPAVRPDAPATAEPPPATPPRPVPPAPAEPPPATPPPESPVPPSMSKRPGGFLRLHGGGERGAVPGTTGALGLAGGGLWPRLRLELQATVLAPRTAAGSQADVRVLLLAGSLHACARLGRGALEVPLCGGLELGAMRGAARGLASGVAASSAWLAAALGVGVAWHVAPRVSVWAALQLVLAPVRPRFELSNSDRALALFTPAFASGRLLVGVELRLRDPW